MTKTALLALEDGSVFYGVAIGGAGTTTGEVVFNTAMTGYQEILTDPSYHQQLVTLTHPHIGNVGVNNEDTESAAPYASGLIIRDLPIKYSNWRAQQSLSDYLREHQVLAIADIDTRRLTRLLRDKGAQRGCLMAGDLDSEKAIQKARACASLRGVDLAQQVTTSTRYTWQKGSWLPHQQIPTQRQNSLRLIVYDFGVKRNILRIFFDLGCNITVVPATTSADAVLAEAPDGIFLSNGPGDPAPCNYAIEAIQTFLQRQIPLFGICLGHQLLALACGATTMKMKFGHHGANHPVQCLDSGLVMVSSQNHGFAVTEEDLPETLIPTHRSLFDGSLQGLKHRDLPAFGFQGHPEASPGPHDLRPIFQCFIDLMEQYKNS